MKALGYVRVSTDEQAREGISLEAQEAKIRAYAELNDLELIDVVVDAGLSGKNLNRPGVKRLLAACAAGDTEAVIVYKLDRLTRKTKDLLFLVEDVFAARGVQFHSLSEKIDTTTAQGKFFLTLMGAMAQMERDLISERTRDALAHKRAQGQKTGGDVPFGYDATDDGHLVALPEEQGAIRFMRRLRGMGLSLRAVAARLEARGYSPRRGGSWTAIGVSRVLEREAV
jgi:DNA invertase Pin-like site-specific DNA recombinase